LGLPLSRDSHHHLESEMSILSTAVQLASSSGFEIVVLSGLHLKDHTLKGNRALLSLHHFKSNRPQKL